MNSQRNPPDSHRTDLGRCVKCGLCLPVCPTYQRTQNEAESPRGRITIISALLAGELTADSLVDRHLENCLLCRRCETACPSEVPFGRLMDAARVMTFRHRKRKHRYLGKLITDPGLLRRAISLAPLAKIFGGQLGELAAYFF